MIERHHVPGPGHGQARGNVHLHVVEDVTVGRLTRATGEVDAGASHAEAARAAVVLERGGTVAEARAAMQTSDELAVALLPSRLRART